MYHRLQINFSVSNQIKIQQSIWNSFLCFLPLLLCQTWTLIFWSPLFQIILLKMSFCETWRLLQLRWAIWAILRWKWVHSKSCPQKQSTNTIFSNNEGTSESFFYNPLLKEKKNSIQKMHFICVDFFFNGPNNLGLLRSNEWKGAME